ncbi:uncharacterized protein CcaverHIS019_0705470 [Cutaneotrichosporon cavernicola]|uniref:ARM repeat-containing protein n=1 Tax=Cutaneotrichosporon cavernicola TaxID=279322 RepID=A0AA48QZ17_9TREE|nr:uncharacterized protein CcaverHIS019_0705470 [Cutaneotrichosporon cavernicola]BEI94966.1 hypothetical protein CcaverHIS019_0705470 [Cutaneotrichosporon cavernicola]BEJ02740.1 hypothetical protein CcaverHIS631_0705350 [Cutaneotrichosporon cavernicola]BEJ10493.1 hypothetical protein CcaverHIS641_0705280 [Cutaneotrichosporon cavernicola]
MADLAQVTKSLGDIVLSAGEGDEPVQLSAVLESFSSALLGTRDPVMREAFLEAVLDVLKPQGDTSDRGRLAVLHDAALNTLPAFLPLLPDEHAREFLDLLAKHGDPREVVLGLNLAINEITELADPYAVSEGEEDEEDEINWASAFPQLEAMLDMFAVAVPRLQTKRSTPTLLAMQDVLIPLFKAVPTSAPPEIAVDLSRSILSRTAKLVEAAWGWQAKTEDAGGEQNSVLNDILNHAVMVFGPNVGAELTPRQFLAAFPRYAGLHKEEGWEEGQSALDAATAACGVLGIGRACLIERIRSSSAVRPQASIASLILLASAPPTEFPASTLEDAMPIISICLNGSATDAGAALVWALVRAGVTVAYDQVTFLLEHIMPLIQLHQSANTRLALGKLLGALIGAVKSPRDQIKLFEQLLEPINPFDNIRVLALSLLRDALSNPALLIPFLTETLTPILYRLPTVDSPLDLTLPKLLESFWPVWLTESANFVWFLLGRDSENLSGFADQSRLTSLRNLWLAPVAAKAKVWTEEGRGGEGAMILDGLVDACVRASAGIDAKRA